MRSTPVSTMPMVTPLPVAADQAFWAPICARPHCWDSSGSAHEPMAPAVAGALGRAGHDPTRVSTTAKVHLEKGDAGFRIPRIDLVTEAVVPGMEDAQFQEIAETAKKNCPVSQVLAGADISLQATLVR